MAYERTGNLLRKIARAVDTDRIEVEVGDAGTFRPRMRLKRWGGEAALGVEFPSLLNGAALGVDDGREVITWVRGDYTLKWYPQPDGEEYPEGGWEFELTLGKRPPKSSFTFNIETGGLAFYFQPPLNAEPLPEGGVFATETDVFDAEGNVIAHRPANVVNSYAVYWEEHPANVAGGKLYRTGKVCHIYRPRLTDAKGNSTWGSVVIDAQAGTMTIAADAAWLAAAAYPVAVDPTFGYTSVGASEGSSWDICASVFAAPESGTISSVTGIVKASYHTYKLRFGVYSSALSLLGDSGDVSVGDTTKHWITGTISASITSGANYWLASGNNPRFNYTNARYYDSGSTNQGAAQGADAFPATLSPTYNNLKFSIYATYTAGGGGTDALTANGITTGAPTLGAPTLTQNAVTHNLTATAITAGTPTLGAPQVGQVHALTAAAISATAPVLGQPAIGQVHVLSGAATIAGAPDLGTPAIGQSHVLTATAIATGAPAVGSPTVGQAHVLTAAGIAAAAPELGAPTIGQIHALIAVVLDAQAPALGAPAIGQVHALTATGIVTGQPVLDAPSMEYVPGTDALTALPITAGAPVVGSPTLGQIHTLTAEAITAGQPALDTPALVQIVALTAVGITAGAPQLTAPAIGQVHALTASGIVTGTPEAGQPAIGQVHVLVAALLLAGAPVLGAPYLFLGQIVTPTERVYTIRAENRTYTVAAENRTFVIAAENRTYTVRR
jgi:hypothetical protein